MSSEKKNKKKRIIITVLICLLAFAVIGGAIVVALTVTDPEYKRSKANKKTVATCNGYDIPYEELRFLTYFYMDELAAEHGEDIWKDPELAKTYRAELEERLMDNLNFNYMILSACEELDIDTDNEDAEAYADGMIESMKSEAESLDMTWDAYLEKNHATERYLHFFYKTQYLLNVIHNTMLDEGMYTYTMSNSTEFLSYVKDPEKYARTVHIYIENDEGESAEKNERLAERISDELRAEKSANVRYATMREYIMMYDEALDDVTGYGHHFPRGQMDTVYEEATFSLDAGEVSEAFAYQNGYMIVMRLDVDSDYVKKTAVLGTLLQNMQYVEMNSYIEGFRDACKIEMNDYGKSLDLLNLPAAE